MKLTKCVLLFFLFTTTSVISADRSSLDYFRLSIEEIQKSFSIGNDIALEQGAVVTLTQSQVNQIVYHAKKSLRYSKFVKDDDLDWMDPSLIFKSLSKNYEKLFRSGLRFYIESWEKGDLVIGIRANKLLNEWGDYYKKIRKKII